MTVLKNEIGNKYGKLKVLYIYGKAKNRQIIWLCQCECGNYSRVRGDGLRNGKVLSCGCYGRLQRIKSITTHNFSKSPEFLSWTSMKSRCNNSNDAMFYLYGGRGIKVCHEWENSFEQFYKDMGCRPSKKYSIERINNNKGYFKLNCKWTTPYYQSRNKRTNRMITFNNESLLLCDWAKKCKISVPALRIRLESWTLQQALLTPKRANKYDYS